MSLLENDHVYRMAHITMRDKKNKSVPAIRCFSPTSADDYKLSVDHAESSSVEISISRVGATYKRDGSFKNLREFEVYRLNVSETKAISGIIDVYSDPIFSDPETPGIPNNPAHALIEISRNVEEDEPEIYLRLRDNAIKMDVDYDKASVLSDQIKSKWII